MVHFARCVAALVAATVLLAGCSTNGDDDSDEVQTVPESTTSTTSTLAPVTTTVIEDDAVPGSTAVITVGPARYELDAVCASGGAGEIEVSVAGTDVNGLLVSGYVRGFLGEPYVSFQVGDGADAVLFEPRLEGVIPIEFTDDGMRLPEVDFVSGLDLESGEFTPAGIGSVEVSCVGYERSLPDENALPDQGVVTDEPA